MKALYFGTRGRILYVQRSALCTPMSVNVRIVGGTVFMLKLIRVLSKLLVFDFVLLATTTLLAVSRKNRQ